MNADATVPSDAVQQDSWERLGWFWSFFFYITLLVAIYSVFYFLLFSLYGQLFVILPLRFAIVVSVFLTGLVAYLQIRDAGGTFSPTTPILWLYAMLAVFGVAFARWINAIARVGPTAPLHGSGCGLQAMRERVEMLDGSLLIASAPAEGTRLVVEIPVLSARPASPASTEFTGANA